MSVVTGRQDWPMNGTVSNVAGCSCDLTATPSEGNLYLYAECNDCKVKDARIAELEVENSGLVFHRDALLEELDDMKARRCWTCRHRITLSHGGNAYKYPECPLYGNNFEANGFCYRWEARA